MKSAFAVLLFLAITLPTAALAAASEWVTVKGGAVRLITAGPPENGTYWAGLEFQLEPGWHTYWRYPGEAGIPPQITWTNTSNIQDKEVLYPVPERYSDGFSDSIVYHDGIILPLKISPEDASKPAQISLELFFGVCKDICVPGEATLSLPLDPDARPDSLSTKLIKRDLQAVPGIAPTGGLNIVSVTLVESDGKRLRIEAETGSAGTPDLFAAGPEGSYIALPKLAEGETGNPVWHLSTKGLKTTASDTSLRLVLSDGENALEHLAPIQPDWLN
ncbi:hypothetical protein J7481_14500 [Labrenzia sp. R4_2]|uniref:protein-disulfide reductase DsbD domain-containing protein n=1 Tax=Labrenzia sp. R4_2 TaxID=2821107 RepID=UPI001ADB4C4C|nr:protein-disulfide reductase DsbD domain-containing protein [Labrenzia sp. R4_2]MBO9420711.1 hypothetical protein [Labrenzia sp. R4_2]